MQPPSPTQKWQGVAHAAESSTASFSSQVSYRELQDWQSGAGVHPLEVVSVQRLNKPRLVT